MKKQVTKNEAKQRIAEITKLYAFEGYTFTGIFRKVMKHLKNGTKFDKGLYSAVKKSDSKVVKTWIDETLNGL